MREQVVQLRGELEREGLDAGAHSVHARLERIGLTPPSVSTIWRILRAAGQVTPQPHKRPKSSIRRFAAACPNECWQSDMTHWHLADSTGVEILSWLDDHARFLVRITAHQVVTAPTVTTEFLAAANAHGLPASVLTDNGLIFTTRFAHGIGGPNHFEHVLADLGITQKNGHPGHPQTQGKIERFHQTLKRWLNARPGATGLPELQEQLDQFQRIYNTERPHRAIGRRTPIQAYTALPKAVPDGTGSVHYRIRHDIVDPGGTITLRWAGHLRHLGIGRGHQRTPVTILTAADHAIITDRHGQILAEIHLNPNRDYQPKNAP
jgi:transposase InsO family protein